MVKEFLEGETYRNDKFEQDIFVLGINELDDKKIIMLVLWIDRETVESTSGDEILIQKSKFNEWSQVDLA